MNKIFFSVYLVTKYINVGMDNDNSNGTNKHFAQMAKFSDEISEEKMKGKSKICTISDDYFENTFHTIE